MRAGDVVYHRPTGETWLLAWGTEMDVSPCGWPESIAKSSDCDLVKAATNDEHITMLRRWAIKSNDYRASMARRQLGEAGIDGAI